jgi:hypothetical protein
MMRTAATVVITPIQSTGSLSIKRVVPKPRKRLKVRKSTVATDHRT